MPQYRLLVAVKSLNNLAVDDICNTIYINDTNITTDPANLANDCAQLWATYRMYPTNVNKVVVKVYDMADPEPRAPKATEDHNITGQADGSGPREVALCLSYYAGRNIKRQRGRLYLGPFGMGRLHERPENQTMNELVTLAEGIGNLGGFDCDWQLYSPTANDYKTVTNYWIDNEWDTQRSRGLRGTTRVLGDVEETS